MAAWADGVRAFCGDAGGLVRDFWKWLDGKKTGIAAAYWLVVDCVVPFVWPAPTHPGLATQLTIAGAVLTALGLGHKAIKAGAPAGDAGSVKP